MTVTRIEDVLDMTILEALDDLKRRHLNGQLKGLAFSIKIGPRRHRIGFTGAYWDDPHEALGCVTRMEYKLNQLISSRDEEPETNTMPL